MSASSEKWTPGPWELREVAHEATPYSKRRVYRMEIIAPQYLCGKRTHSRDIAQMVDYCDWTDHPHNARLIAAAPDLYEALADVIANGLPDMPKSCGHDFLCVCPELKAKAALAKARGEL